MLKFYDNEYGFIKMQKAENFLTHEFKYCTLTCTLVRGGNKDFPTLQNGLVVSIKTLTFHLKKSTGVTCCWLVQRCISYQVCFSLPDKPNLVSFHHISNTIAGPNVETNIY